MRREVLAYGHPPQVDINKHRWGGQLAGPEAGAPSAFAEAFTSAKAMVDGPADRQTRGPRRAKRPMKTQKLNQIKLN